MYKFICRDCGGSLYLDPERVSANGKRIPINVANNENHQCPKRRFSKPCRDCHELIYFDDSKLSKSGKKIPLNNSDGNPHSCLLKDTSLTYNTATTTE